MDGVEPILIIFERQVLDIADINTKGLIYKSLYVTVERFLSFYNKLAKSLNAFLNSKRFTFEADAWSASKILFLRAFSCVDE